MAAVKAGSARFNFLGSEIRLVPTCGVFVTMNPGYAGRSELPDNLKAIVRPVSMMVPDFTLIAEIMMFAEGFAAARPLSKKMIAIMELSQQQLSKQVRPGRCGLEPVQSPEKAEVSASLEHCIAEHSGRLHSTTARDCGVQCCMHVV